MKGLFFMLSRFLICALGTSYEVMTSIGEDVDLKCLGVEAGEQIFRITWSTANDTDLFTCLAYQCDVNGTRHSIGKEERYVSILHIQNVTLKDENEYSSSMRGASTSVRCDILLVVNVPPTGLILIDKDDEILLPSNGSLIVPEGENKTIVCKTSTSVKPAVGLEWMIPKGLNVISEYAELIPDEQDKRLFVSRRTLIFSPTYQFRKDIPLGCNVANDSSIDHTHRLIHIKKKGEITTTTENRLTSSKENKTFARTDGDFEDMTVSEASYATATTSSVDTTLEVKTRKRWFVITGGASMVILLLLPAIVGGIMCSKKKSAKRTVRAESIEDITQTRSFQVRGALPAPPSDQSFLNANHLPDRQPSPARSFRPAPSFSLDIPMRQMVPVSADTTGSTPENSQSRGATSRGASANISASHSQRGLATDMEYDMLNDMEYDVLNMEYAVVNKTPSKTHGAVPHVYRETTDGLAEYALVSRPKMGKNALQPRFRNTEQLDAEFEYAVVDKSDRRGRESVPHVYTQTMSGLEEYAVVNKPKDIKKRQSEVRHTTAPGDNEAEYAVVDKWKKN